MADTKITGLTAVSAAAASMLIPVVEDPSGTPATKKMTITQLITLLGSSFQGLDSDLTAIAALSTTAKGRAILAHPYGAAQHYGGQLVGADFNTTSDQAITLSLPAGYTLWRFNNIFVTNASISLTTAVGGFYTGAGKTGTTIIANSQVYTALTGAAVNSTGNFLALSAAGSVVQTLFNHATIYLSLSTPQGAAATADVYVSLTPIL